MLDILCELFSEQRNLRLSEMSEGKWAVETGGLSIFYELDSVNSVFYVTRYHEASCTSFREYNSSLQGFETFLQIEIKRGCLRDYLSMLTRQKGEFSKKVCTLFEKFLSETGDSDDVLSTDFEDARGSQILEILDCFYPKP